MNYSQVRYKQKLYNAVVENEAIYPIKGSFYDEWRKTGECFDIKDVVFMPPSIPSKVIAVGLNYKKHAKELGFDLPQNPIIFLKPPTTVIGNLDNIVYPDSVKQLDYEAELGIVIKKLTKNIDKNDAKDYILGYTCSNDVTARCIQKIDGQWSRAKSFDSFCPVGPVIATDIDPKNLDIELRLNGELKQKSNTKDMIFDVFEIVEFISKIMTLFPGDIIITGTPEGIGPMNQNDIVEVKIQDIGTLKNFVK